MKGKNLWEEEIGWVGWIVVGCLDGAEKMSMEEEGMEMGNGSIGCEKTKKKKKEEYVLKNSKRKKISSERLLHLSFDTYVLLLICLLLFDTFAIQNADRPAFLANRQLISLVFCKLPCYLSYFVLV